jgi:predicted dehydrogenase
VEALLKVGIIGFGGAGMAQLGHFNNIAGSEVLAIYDPKPGGIARARSAAPHAKATGNLDEFLSLGINTVAVCSPDNTHADYIVAAIEAGKHVVCEKPLADSMEGCRKVLAAEAKSRGVVAAVQHQMRFLPVHVEMKRIIDSGRLGTISYIEGYYVHNLTSRAYLYDDWRSTDNATPLVYSGCHFVDLLRWLLNDEVEEVMAMSNHLAFPQYPESDLNVVLLRFRSGVIGKVVVAFGAGRPQDHSVRIYGSEMSIENNLLFSKKGDFTVFARPHLPKDERFMRRRDPAFFSIRGRGWGAYPSRYGRHLLTRLIELLMKARGQESCYEVTAYPIRLYPHGLAVRASLLNFTDAIRGKGQLQCSLKESARTVATCLAGVEAYRSRKCVKVSDFWLPELD